MEEYKRLKTPLTSEDVLSLKAGDAVLISGIIYGARDAAHKRLIEEYEKTGKLPFDLKGQIIYYVGPSPAKPGKVIGSAGPTTSIRMDPYTPKMLELGVKATIGKGERNEEVKEAMKKYKAVYLATVGGAGALIAQRIKSVRIIAYEDLGPEAITEMVVEDFPAIVAVDAYGNDLYAEGIKKYAKI
jgi:fumarate hydratase subunit beta